MTLYGSGKACLDTESLHAGEAVQITWTVTEALAEQLL